MTYLKAFIETNKKVAEIKKKIIWSARASNKKCNMQETKINTSTNTYTIAMNFTHSHLAK